jgi:hypothetical protein
MDLQLDGRTALIISDSSLVRARLGSFPALAKTSGCHSLSWTVQGSRPPSLRAPLLSS